MKNVTTTALINAGLVALAYVISKLSKNLRVTGLVGIAAGVAMPIINNARTGHVFRIWK